MKSASLLIAVGVLLVLGFLVWYAEENPPETGEEKPKIISVEENDIVEVTISRPNTDSITLQRGRNNEWQFDFRHTFPPEDSTIKAMVSSLAKMNADRVVEEQVQNWTPYGLDGSGTLEVNAVASEEQLGLEKESAEEINKKKVNSKTYRVIFGNNTPTGAGVYLRLVNDPRLFTVLSYVKNSFDKNVFDLRDKNLLQIDEEKISHVAVNAGGRSIEFGRSGNDDWQILKPRLLRADNFTVGDLVRSVAKAKMISVLAKESSPSKKYRFRRSPTTVKVVDEVGEHSLTIAKSRDDTYYAKSSDLSGIYEVSATIVENLDQPLIDFRNKKLFDFGFSEITSLVLRDGEIGLHAEKRNDKWVLSSQGDRELDSERVQMVIDSLRSLAAISFPSDEAADQARFGLDRPAIEVEVTAAEDGTPERVLINWVSNGRVYAARKGQPTTYEVEKTVAEEIRRAIQELPHEGEGSEREESQHQGSSES